MKKKKVANGQAIPEFERLVAIETDECVLWPYSVTLGPNGGYGRLRVGKRTRPVHQLACELHHGPRPFPKAQAAHSCRNKNCLNPRHLRWDDAFGNQADRVKDGTAPRGEQSGLAKLTESDVRRIRRCYDCGVGPSAIAAEFGVQPSAICKIGLRRSWAWLPEERITEGMFK